MPSATNYSSSITYSALGNPNFQSGNREDLTDIISLIAPEEFPLQALASKTKAVATYHEWQMDDYAGVDITGFPEGQDVTAFNNEASPRVRTGNFVQRFLRPYAVSVEQSLVNIAGVGNEFDRSKMKATKELMRSIEAAFCSDNDMSAGGSAGNAQARALGSWINNTAQSTNPVPTAYLTPAAQTITGGATLSESAFKGLLQALYYQTGNSELGYDMLAGATVKAQIANFNKAAVVSSTALNTIRQTSGAAEKTIYDGIDLYKGDFGDVRIHRTMFNGLAQGSTVKSTTATQLNRAYILRPELIEIAHLRDVGAQELPDLGGGRRGFVDALLTLVVKNPLGLGKIST